jgi:hypothetical protein
LTLYKYQSIRRNRTMPTVWADEEEVTFTDDIPVDPSSVYELLMGALSEQGRAVVRFIVDGEDSLEKGSFPEKYEKIEAFSLSHDELTFRLVIEAMNHLSSTHTHLAAYSQNILSVAWSEVFKRMDEFIQKIQPFADLIDNLVPYVSTYDPPWKEAFEAISKEQSDTLGGILRAFEHGSPAMLSNELSDGFMPVFNKSRKLFETEIIPFLKVKVDSKAS